MIYSRETISQILIIVHAIVDAPHLVRVLVVREARVTLVHGAYCGCRVDDGKAKVRRKPNLRMEGENRVGQ